MGGKLTKRIADDAGSEAGPYFLWDAGDGSVKGFGLSVLPSGKKTFVAQFRIGSGRAAKSRRVSIGQFGAWTVEQARERARDLIREGNGGIDRVETARVEAREQAQAEAIEKVELRLRRDLRVVWLCLRYIREHVVPKRSPRTADAYRAIVRKHIARAPFAAKDARDLSYAEVDRWHRTMVAGPVTANRALGLLDTVLRWAVKRELLDELYRNPARRVERRAEPLRDRHLSGDELGRLGAAIREAETVGIAWEPRQDGKAKHAPRPENRLTKIDPAAAAALRLLIFTGARLREILNLRWDQVDLDLGVLILSEHKTAARTGTKSIVLNSMARAVIAGIGRSGEYVIKGDGEGPRADLKRPWRLVTKAAGLEGLRIHDLRHSFASVGVGGGQGLAIVGKLLGHSQARTTERYAHLDADPLRNASDEIAGRIAAAMGEAPAGTVIEFHRGQRDAS